jgi:hypothetical protein
MNISNPAYKTIAIKMIKDSGHINKKIWLRAKKSLSQTGGAGAKAAQTWTSPATSDPNIFVGSKSFGWIRKFLPDPEPGFDHLKMLFTNQKR